MTDSYQEVRVLVSEKAPDFLERYEHAGGQTECVLRLLSLLFKGQGHKPLRRRSRTASLKKCACSLKEALAVEDLHPRLRRSLSQAHRDLELFLKATLTEEERSIAWRESGLGKPGRRRGPTLDSLVPAILAFEFRRRLGSLCYREILTLLRAVAPAKFPPTVTAEHIRQRVRKIPSGRVRAYHDHFFW